MNLQKILSIVLAILSVGIPAIITIYKKVKLIKNSGINPNTIC